MPIVSKLPTQSHVVGVPADPPAVDSELGGQGWQKPPSQNSIAGHPLLVQAVCAETVRKTGMKKEIVVLINIDRCDEKENSEITGAPDYRHQ